MEYLQHHHWLLALVIFLARVADVSLGTLRTILVFRSYQLPAAVLGFVEIVIWVMAAGQVFQNLDAWYLALAYAGGFAAGTAVGVRLEAKLAMGLELVRAISKNPDVELATSLRKNGYSVTELQGLEDESVPVEVLLVVERRTKRRSLISLIEESDPDAVYTISDVRGHGGPGRQRTLPQAWWGRIVKRK